MQHVEGKSIYIYTRSLDGLPILALYINYNYFDHKISLLSLSQVFGI